MHYLSLIAALLTLSFGGNFANRDVAPIIIPPFTLPALPIFTVDEGGITGNGVISWTCGPGSVGVVIEIGYPNGTVVSDIQIPGNPGGTYTVPVYPGNLVPDWGDHIIRVAEIIQNPDGTFVAGQIFEFQGILAPQFWTPPLGPNEF